MSRFMLPDDQVIVPGVPFEYAGNLYPANYLQFATTEEKDDLGMIEIEDDAPVDGRFYFGAGMPRPIADCKKVHINAINAYVASMMSQTDWEITRAAEGYKPANEETLTFRAELRNHGNDLVDEVNALTTVSSVIAWQQHDWPAPAN